MGRLKFRLCATVAIVTALCLSSARAAQQKSLLEQARVEAAAGRFDRASELYRKVLQVQPDNTDALGGLADALEATGRWREAISSLARLVELEPNNAARLFQLGRMKSWQEGERAHALELLKRAAELQPDNPDYQVGYVEVLSWSADQRGEALGILRAVLARHPTHADGRRLLARILGWQKKRDAALALLEPLIQRANSEAEDFWALGQVEEASDQTEAAASAYRQALERNPNHLASIARLAEILSWSAATRPEAARLFEHGLQLDLGNEALLVAYAEMLSWNRASRPRAMKYYEQVLAKNPTNPRALTGEAQLLAWNGRSNEAWALYEKVLSLDPSNGAALRGKAEILNWRGQHATALDLLSRARASAPDDSRTLLELARANYGLRHYVEAQSDLAQAKGATGPGFEELRRGINQALGTYTELGYGLRRNRRRLDYDRFEALVSTPLGAANRVSLLYRPTLYRAQQRDFNSNYYALSLDSQPSEKISVHAKIAGENYPGAPPQADGALNVRYQVRPSFELEAGFQRRTVEDTLLSTRGEETNGLFLGQVRSNLGSIGGTYTNREHHYDISLTYTDGVYTGRNLDTNRRWGVDANIGKSLHSYQPYLRIAYGFTYLSFGHDADFQPGAAPPRVTGGYFSPLRYFLNSGSIYLSHELGRRVKWDAGGTLGVQNAETTTSALSDARFASSFSTHLVWSVNAQNDVRIGYDFLNVFNAFRRNLLRVTWRHYF